MAFWKRFARFSSMQELGDLAYSFVPILMVGVLGSLVGIIYLWLLHMLESGLGPENWSYGARIGVMAAVGFAVAVIVRLLGSPGSVELLVDNIHVLGGREQHRELRSLIPVSLLCIAGGGAMGPEAPLVQTTGALGAWLGGRRNLSVPDRRVLTITGMAAGFTVLFGAPLGAAVFALEILHRRGLEYYEALMPAVAGSLCGLVVFVIATGQGLRPVWQFPSLGAIRPADMGWAALTGVIGSAVAFAFVLTHRLLNAFMRGIPEFFRPPLTGVLLGLLSMGSIYSLTFGESQLNSLFTMQNTWTLFLIVAGAKFLGTSLTLAGGWRGGFIIPLFFIGAALAHALACFIPQANVVVLTAAMMSAINTGVTKTPLGSTLVVSEMAGLTLAPTTLLASMVALLLTRPISMIASQRQRDMSPTI